MQTKKKQSGFYLSGKAAAALEKLALEQGRGKSEIVSSAIVYYSNLPDALKAAMDGCMAIRNEDILRQMRAEFSRPRALRRKKIV